MRTEKDSLGELELPADALYGINTARAVENFPLSMRPLAFWPLFTQTLATVKQAAARANLEIGALSKEQAEAIDTACQEVKSGKHDAHLVVDMLEGSGGTSPNMNMNEVIANVVAKNSGRQLSDYSLVHPNDHVNRGQSTNDAIPTAMELALYRSLEQPVRTLRQLADSFGKRRVEYANLLRLGRTCLQDAQPMTLGQALGGYEAVIRRHADHLNQLRGQFLTVPLGGTAIGTGFGSRPGYKAAVYRHLCSLFNAAVVASPDAFDGMQNIDKCSRLSGELRNTANSMCKIATDLMSLSSGPSGGIGEITLPSMQAGSSIMPGKVNPVIPMAVCQVAFAITGNDATVAMAVQHGMLEVNHYESLVCDRLFDSLRLLNGAAEIFAKRCIDGFVANEEVSLQHVLSSSAMATALVPMLGYAQVSSIVRAALAERRPFVDVAVERGHMKKEEVVSIVRRSLQVEEEMAGTV